MKLFATILCLALAGKKCGKPKEGDDGAVAVTTTTAPAETTAAATSAVTTAAPATTTAAGTQAGSTSRRLASVLFDDEEDEFDMEEGRELASHSSNATTAAPADAPKCATGGLDFEVRGRSGKMLFYKKGARADGIVVQMDSITERAADGTAVGVGGNGKHSFKSFATQDFTISEMEESDYMGIDAYKTTFFADINGGNFTVNIYLMTQNGTITNGDEEIAVKPGQFKFTVNIDGWKWCNGHTPTDEASPEYCGKKNKPEVGTMLDFALEIKGKNGPKAKGDDTAKPGKRPAKKNGKNVPAEIDLGNGAAISLSTKVQVDDVWGDMPDWDHETTAYPLVETQGPKTTYTFRFPKAAKIFYDPGVDMGVTEAEFQAAMEAEESASGATTTAATDATTAAPEATTTAAGGDDAAADSAAAVSILGAMALLMH
jgi:hypothetical protein